MLVAVGIHVSRLRGREEWCPPVLLFLEKFPKDPGPSSAGSEFSK